VVFLEPAFRVQKYPYLEFEQPQPEPPLTVSDWFRWRCVPLWWLFTWKKDSEDVCVLQKLELACCGVDGNATCCSTTPHNETDTCYCPPCLQLISSPVYDSVVAISVICVISSFPEVRMNTVSAKLHYTDTGYGHVVYNTANGRARNNSTACCRLQQIHHQWTKICHIPTSWHVEMLGSGIAMWQICCTTSCRECELVCWWCCTTCP